MTTKSEVSINLNNEQLKLLRELIDSEYFQVSGVAEISKMGKLKEELALLKELASKLRQPTLVAY